MTPNPDCNCGLLLLFALGRSGLSPGTPQRGVVGRGTRVATYWCHFGVTGGSDNSLPDVQSLPSPSRQGGGS